MTNQRADAISPSSPYLLTADFQSKRESTLGRIRDENGEDDGDDDSEHTDEDVSEGELNIQTLSNEDPTKDRVFIILNTYEPSNEDSDSEDNSEDANNKPTAED
jgi:hypothetical protein